MIPPRRDFANVQELYDYLYACKLDYVRGLKKAGKDKLDTPRTKTAFQAAIFGLEVALDAVRQYLCGQKEEPIHDPQYAHYKLKTQRINKAKKKPPPEGPPFNYGRPLLGDPAALLAEARKAKEEFRERKKAARIAHEKLKYKKKPPSTPPL